MNACLGPSRISMGRRVQDALSVGYAQIDRAMVQYTSDEFEPLSRARGKKLSPDLIDNNLPDMSLESVTFNILLREVSPSVVSRTIRCNGFLETLRWYF